MRSVHSQWCQTVVKCAIFIHFFIPCTLSCILLLNGWTPLSVYERTALADVVLSGEVVRTYKGYRSLAQTYTSSVKILHMYKGETVIKKIQASPAEQGGKLYNISNFGDKKMCYADVDENGRYIFFLTEYKGRLSAQYDDIFGAAVDYTESNEDEVIQQLGWDVWSTWGSCSTSCDSGVQLRRRLCRKENTTCAGSDVQHRQCNTFSCKGTKNLLEVFRIYDLPVGVSRDTTRTTSYNISSRANLYTPLTALFSNSFPVDFSIIMTVKLASKEDGYLFTISDIMGKQRLAIKCGKHLSLEYYDQNDLPGFKSPKFGVNLADNKWHQFAFSVKGQTIKLYIDCDDVISKTFIRSDHPSIGVNLVAAVGPYFARYGQPFKGAIEQLTIVLDSDAAALQCHTQTGDANLQDQAIKDEGLIEVSPSPTPILPQNTTVKEQPKQPQHETVTVMETQWSDWSACSTSCGQGTQTRQLYCVNNEISIDECVDDDAETRQIRTCENTSCQDECLLPCLNGGRCEGGHCVCMSGFRGDHCQNEVCSVVCENGGNCTSANVCSCPRGYTGQRCEQAVCKPRCRNGGRCTSPGVCTCTYGYMPPLCKPFCSAVCHNGGRCVRHNRCKCRKGYRGKDCSEPICRRGCFNGGRCVAPNKCSCPPGYTGRKCHKPVCNPPCQNKGACIYPYVCRCKRGFYGPYCEQYACRRTCKNGGTCVGHNKCACREGFSGKWCQKGSCKKPCLNGGKCRKRGCRCPAGYGGDQCERKGCKYEKYVAPYQKTYKIVQRDEYLAQCGPWKWRQCVKTRLKYITASKVLYRTLYRCI